MQHILNKEVCAHIHQATKGCMLSSRVEKWCMFMSFKVQLHDLRHKPAKDFQKLRHSIEVLSFIYEPEKQAEHNNHTQK